MKNTVRVNLCSQNLVVVSDEPVEYVMKLAEDLGDRISEIEKANKYKPAISNVLLCALQYLDEKNKLNNEIEKLKKENEKLSAEYNRLVSNALSSRAVAVPKKQQSFFDNDMKQPKAKANPAKSRN